jgi:hypothetical protein
MGLLKFIKSLVGLKTKAEPVVAEVKADVIKHVTKIEETIKEVTAEVKKPKKEIIKKPAAAPKQSAPKKPSKKNK